jgi:hypothetical protein
MPESSVVIWRGELLWPQDLPEADIIDLGQVEVLGVWVHDWFRSRPGQAVTRANPAVRRQLTEAGVPVTWSDHPQRSGGVSSAERAGLFE